jgi:hypothetical protein
MHLSERATGDALNLRLALVRHIQKSTLEPTARHHALSRDSARGEDVMVYTVFGQVVTTGASHPITMVLNWQATLMK